MPGDNAGNSLNTARLIYGGLGVQTFSDRVDTLDSKDYYQFSLTSSASLRLHLGNLSADANLQLLNSSGAVIQSSTNPNITPDAITTLLNPGIYYIQVFPKSFNQATDYTLTVDLQLNTNLGIVWRDYANGVNETWWMAGDNNTAVASSSPLLTTDSLWQTEVISDFNKDGIPDIFWREYKTGMNVIWLMGGANQSSPMSVIPVQTIHPSWQIEGIGDFNRDGTNDLIWRQTTSGYASVWFMDRANPANLTAAALLPPASPNWSIEGAADFNQDGNPDLVWRDATTGLNSVWFMGGVNNLTYTSIALLDSRPSNWAIAGISDFNRDGSPDIFWRDYATGNNEVWIMGGLNNLVVQSTVAIAPTPTSWRAIPFTPAGQVPPPDLAGNSLNTAFDIGVLGIATYQDAVSSVDSNDYYRFVIPTRSTFNLSLRGLVADADVQLLNGNGVIIQTSNQAGVVPETIATTLEAGNYFVRIYPYNRATPYTLNLSATPIATPQTIVSLTTPDATAAEAGIGPLQNPGQFLISRTGSTATALTVNFSISGTASNGVDYVALPTRVVIPVGQTSVVLPLSVLDDAVIEPDESVILTLLNGTGYSIGSSNRGTVTITDNDALPTLTISASDTNAAETLISETANPGQFTLTRTGSTATALTVNYTIGGSATNGRDFTTIASSITIPIGQSSVIIPVNIIDDTQLEGNETVVLTLNPRNAYTLGTATTATVTIADNDQVQFTNFTIIDASGDTTPNTVFQKGALQLSYALSGNPAISQVRLEAVRNNTVVSTLGTWTTASLTGAIVNLDNLPSFTGGDYQLRAVARTTSNQDLFSVFQPFKVLSWNQPTDTTFGRFTSDTFTYTGSVGNGQIFVGRGGSDTLNLLSISRSAISGINGIAIGSYNPLNSTSRQAIFRGTAFDFLTLNDGREIYFQGIETLKFADGSLSLQVKPTDPNLGEQWNLHITDVGSAWRFTQGANNVLLVSWDGGIGGPVGAISDIAQSRLITNSTSASDDPEFDFYGDRDGGHGHMAISVMSATANNSTGVTGINWNSRVLVHDLYGNYLDSSTYMSLIASINEAIALARQNGWKVVIQGGIQGYYWLDGVRSQLEQLVQQNSDIALFAVAAGNGYTDIDDQSSPNSYYYGGGFASLQTNFSNVMAIGALRPGTESNLWYQSGAGVTTVDGLTNATSVSLADYSNRGASLTLVAPTDSPAITRFNELEYFGGTSAANPNMAAIASLVWSANASLNATQLRQLLIDTTMDLGTTGRDNTFGYGLVNADAAVRRAIALSRNQSLAGLYSGRSEFA